ncbi:Chloride intracellular channel protein 3 [Ophiophagus hannah]|uniref:Chloride intracellular channel protein 3 n=1 Tax=Ophiophagus hannah TaxID=8665 RepID=V8N6S2_OPHHA|nr:Chloride intracellular channel protein 3 [Ophiophagus hannah]
MAEGSRIQLFVKASTDGETIGHCPFCQRLFMVLLLKGVPFTLTTVDTKRSLDVLKDFAPGAQLPVLLYDGEPKTDTIRIEEFLEETLKPPEFPSLEPKYKESTLAGNDIFHRFSAYIKNPIPAQDEKAGPVVDQAPTLEAAYLRVPLLASAPEANPSGVFPTALFHALLKAFRKLDQYLNIPLDYELVRDPELVISRRRFLDGDQMTLADCNLLPKLNIVNVVCQHYRQAGIPRELRGIGRYLECATETKEFQYTCPNPQEIIQAYHDVVRQP